MINFHYWKYLIFHLIFTELPYPSAEEGAGAEDARVSRIQSHVEAIRRPELESEALLGAAEARDHLREPGD